MINPTDHRWGPTHGAWPKTYDDGKGLLNAGVGLASHFVAGDGVVVRESPIPARIDGVPTLRW